MASKKSEKTDKKIVTKKAAAPKKAPAVKKEAAPKGEAKPRHPKARLVAAHKTKEALAKTLAEALAHADEDTGVIAGRLKTASNSQLLRLHNAVETMKSKYGSRDKLVAHIAGKQSKDKDFTAKLEKLSLPNLLELAKSTKHASA